MNQARGKRANKSTGGVMQKKDKKGLVHANRLYSSQPLSTPLYCNQPNKSLYPCKLQTPIFISTATLQTVDLQQVSAEGLCSAAWGEIWVMPVQQAVLNILHQNKGGRQSGTCM